MAQPTNPVREKLAIRRKLLNKGFTLVELLVVLFIIAVISGAVVLSVSSFGKRNAVQKLAERLHQVFPLAREYAGLHSVVLKFSIEKDRYAFYLLTEKNGEGAWKILYKPDFLSPQKIPEGVRVHLQAKTILNPDEDFTEGTTLEILPTMDMDPFILTVGTERWPDQYRLSLEKGGAILLTQVN